MVCVLYPGRGQDTSVRAVTGLCFGWSVFSILGGSGHLIEGSDWSVCWMVCFVSWEVSGHLIEGSDWSVCWMVCVLYPGRGQDS